MHSPSPTLIHPLIHPLACDNGLGLCVRHARAVQNLQLAYRKLGTEVHRALLAHVRQLTFNTLGGMLLLRDLGAYGRLLEGFEVPTTRFSYRCLVLAWSPSPPACLLYL